MCPPNTRPLEKILSQTLPVYCFAGFSPIITKSRKKQKNRAKSKRENANSWSRLSPSPREREREEERKQRNQKAEDEEAGVFECADTRVSGLSI